MKGGSGWEELGEVGWYELGGFGGVIGNRVSSVGRVVFGPCFFGDLSSCAMFCHSGQCFLSWQ